jgi:hypothetical protein
MTLANRRLYAGRVDINAQYTPENIRKTLEAYNELIGNGDDYTLGALTAAYYHFTDEQTTAWEADIAGYYPSDVQDEIKRHIVYALTHTDENGEEDPIPLKMKWGALGEKKAVIVTYDPTVPSYLIQINGYMAPGMGPMAGRRKKK